MPIQEAVEVLNDRLEVGSRRTVSGQRKEHVGGTYSNGRSQRSQTHTNDLNVPLRLKCEISGSERWNQALLG
jgi:hypothetical protein